MRVRSDLYNDARGACQRRAIGAVTGRRVVGQQRLAGYEFRQFDRVTVAGVGYRQRPGPTFARCRAHVSAKRENRSRFERLPFEPMPVVNVNHQPPLR